LNRTVFERSIEVCRLIFQKYNTGLPGFDNKPGESHSFGWLYLVYCPPDLVAITGQILPAMNFNTSSWIIA